MEKKKKRELHFLESSKGNPSRKNQSITLHDFLWLKGEGEIRYQAPAPSKICLNTRDEAIDK